MNDLSELLGPDKLDALEKAQGQEPTAGNLGRLAAAFGIDAARWAFEQWDLRRRARAKFERAEEMLFDRDGLEMASHERLAAYHAERLAADGPAADLTVGIGADLIALAGRGPAVGYEVDPIRTAMARHNLGVHGLKAEIRFEDALAAAWDFEFAFADPSRRAQGKRLSDPGAFQPDPALLAARMRGLKRWLMKLSPMLEDTFLDGLSAERSFVSFQGECREVLVSFEGKERPDPPVWACSLEAGRLPSGLDEARGSVEPDAFLFEADPAAIRAHALAALGDAIGATSVGDSNGYLTGPNPSTSAWVRPFRVLAHGHADPKRIREELRVRNARVGAVKLRAVREDPTAWMARVRAKGNREVVLILYPVGKSLRFVLAEPG